MPAESFFMDIIYQPFVIFIYNPWLALIPAGLLAALGIIAARSFSTARRLIWIATAMWATYAVYEIVLYISDYSGAEAIRIDLLLIAPILWLLTIIALISLALVRLRNA